MKKILFVMPTLRDGGAERSLVNLLTELPEDKYEMESIFAMILRISIRKMVIKSRNFWKAQEYAIH